MLESDGTSDSESETEPDALKDSTSESSSSLILNKKQALQTQDSFVNLLQQNGSSEEDDIVGSLSQSKSIIGAHPSPQKRSFRKQKRPSRTMIYTGGNEISGIFPKNLALLPFMKKQRRGSGNNDKSILEGLESNKDDLNCTISNFKSSKDILSFDQNLRIKDYETVGELGSGAYATVKRARHLKTNKIYVK